MPDKPCPVGLVLNAGRWRHEAGFTQFECTQGILNLVRCQQSWTGTPMHPRGQSPASQQEFRLQDYAAETGYQRGIHYSLLKAISWGGMTQASLCSSTSNFLEQCISTIAGLISRFKLLGSARWVTSQF